ncbi:unnamed protein product [Arctogadus glacialis]
MALSDQCSSSTNFDVMTDDSCSDTQRHLRAERVVLCHLWLKIDRFDRPQCRSPLAASLLLQPQPSPHSSSEPFHPRSLPRASSTRYRPSQPSDTPS